MRQQEAFLWGAFGAIVPEILKYYKVAIEGKALQIDHSLIYLTMNIIFMVIAGVFTIAWTPGNRLNAVWVGASFPTLFATLAAAAPKIPTT